MGNKKTLSDYSEGEFLDLVGKICRAEGPTEDDDNRLVREFRRISEHPSGSDFNMEILGNLFTLNVILC